MPNRSHEARRDRCAVLAATAVLLLVAGLARAGERNRHYGHDHEYRSSPPRLYPLVDPRPEWDRGRPFYNRDGGDDACRGRGCDAEDDPSG